ncbi:MAG: YegP family protein, partial [Lachnospiraceae bacterium]|nr:YegP family protein [Lachnospiraceae bacterium]
MGKFIVKKTNTGIKFDLKATNGQVVATSQIYKDKSYCLNGIESVRKNAPDANVEDQTVAGFKTEKCPKFEIYSDKS